jgi:GNAT superfamily N-acetyltransferase
MFSGRLANLAAAALCAQAFVVGRRIFFSRGAAQAIASHSPEGLALLAHELTHVEQYRRHGIARFLCRYLSGYLRGRARGGSHAEAYAGIAFEREAEDRARALRTAAQQGPWTDRLSPEGFRDGPPRGA